MNRRGRGEWAILATRRGRREEIHNYLYLKSQPNRIKKVPKGTFLGELNLGGLVHENIKITDSF